MNITRISINGRAHTYKINSLIRQGYKPINIVSSGKSLHFDIDSCSEKTCLAYLDEMCYDYQVKKRRGLKHSLRTLISNNGLFLGLIISIIMLILSTFFVMDIKVIGGDNIDSDLIYGSVKDAGLGRFSYIYSLDKNAIENNIAAIEGISSVSLEVIGVRVYIHIHEELPKENINDYLQPIPVITQHDAIVTRVVALTGTPLVKSGDTVYSGQTLIAPYIEKDNEYQDEPEEPNVIPIRATGMVYGRVWYNKCVDFYEQEKVYERTGNYIEVVEPSYIFSAKNRTDIPYKQYEIEENTYYYNAIFPLKVKYIRYYEVKEITLIRDLNSEMSNIVSKAYIELRAEIPAHAEVVRYWTVIKEVDNCTKIDVYLEAEQRIDDGGKFGEDHYKDFGQT